MVLATSLILTACGGSGGSDDATDGTPADSTTGGDTAATVSEGSSGTPTRDGSVEVSGETFEFSFDPPGRCGLEPGDGSTVAQGFMVDDPTRQVAFLYALADNSPDGQDWLQIVLYDEGGQQLWYSNVGFTGNDVGSVSSLTKSGNTLSATGQLAHQPDGALSDCTAEFTCNQ
jgi:hypothetical protein